MHLENHWGGGLRQRRGARRKSSNVIRDPLPIPSASHLCFFGFRGHARHRVPHLASHRKIALESFIDGGIYNPMFSAIMSINGQLTFVVMCLKSFGACISKWFLSRANCAARWAYFSRSAVAKHQPCHSRRQAQTFWLSTSVCEHRPFGNWSSGAWFPCPSSHARERSAQLRSQHNQSQRGHVQFLP